MSAFYGYPLHNTQEWRDQQAKMGTSNDVSDLKFHKIIATTDPKLTIHYKGHEYGTAREYEAQVYLPQPPQDFIKEYCDAGGIDEVMVEHHVIAPNCCAYPCNHPLDPTEFTCDEEDCDVDCKHLGIYPVINPDNTINIRKNKDSWSREEVWSLCEKAFYERARFDNKPLQSLNIDGIIAVDYFDDWIEKNL